MEFIRRFDRAWARGEGALTVLVLLSMVFVAGFSAGIRNLTRFDIQWANDVLTDMDWADSFLRKATMWLAFLGASQACYYRKHISIDVLIRIAPLRQRYLMHMAAGIIAALITIAMSYSLWKAVELNLAERPIEYEMLSDSGSQHVCDGSAAQLKELEGVEVPTSFCAVRSVIKVFGVTAETPGAAFQLIVPFMFLVMGLRFFGAGVGAGLAVVEGEEALRKLDEEEHARLNAVHAAAGGLVASPLALEPDALAKYTSSHPQADAEIEPDEESEDEAYAEPDPSELTEQDAEVDDDDDDNDDGSNGPQRQS